MQLFKVSILGVELLCTRGPRSVLFLELGNGIVLSRDRTTGTEVLNSTSKKNSLCMYIS